MKTVPRARGRKARGNFMISGAARLFNAVAMNFSGRAAQSKTLKTD
jgi:hypothetical protein